MLEVNTHENTASRIDSAVFEMPEQLASRFLSQDRGKPSALQGHAL